MFFIDYLKKTSLLYFSIYFLKKMHIDQDSCVLSMERERERERERQRERQRERETETERQR